MIVRAPVRVVCAWGCPGVGPCLSDCVSVCVFVYIMCMFLFVFNRV